MSSEKGFRKLKDGKYAGFIYYDPVEKKTMRICEKHGWPDNVYSLEAAKKEKARILAKIDVELTDAKKRHDWINKYQKFDKLFEEFAVWAKRKSPNSWQSSTSFIKNYVFHWYLDLNSNNNPEMWPRSYNKFTDWLLVQEPIKSSTGKLSKNTVNNIIKSLNSFLSFLEREHYLGPFVRCETLICGKEERRGLEAIYSEIEINLVTKRLSQVDPKYATYFQLLCKTGMRASEALGLHVRSFKVREFPKEKKALFKRMADVGIEIYGFILLRDQPKLEYLYDKDGSVPRKPLKGRSEIDPRFNRYLPLIDKDLVKKLIDLKESAAKEERPSYEDQLLFGFAYQPFYLVFRKIILELGLKDKDIHSTRHTFATWLTRKVEGDRSVSEDVLGHSSSAINKRYVHLAEELEANFDSEINDVTTIEAIKFN